ncbi:MAG: hypothetical protein HY867_06085 [Chloroflexi bacterium]|nr:hypothetical protein [Chloroflexota bacterium]
MELNLGLMLDALAAAGEDVDAAVVETLTWYQPNILSLLYRNLRSTSETWTGASGRTLFCNGPLRDGNFIYLELGADTSEDPAPFYKEYGRPKQKAEAFLRPTMQYYRTGGLKEAMARILERLGVAA